MSNKSGISQYIDLTEHTDEERLEEFVRTIDFALDSVQRGKYSISVFADIISVACNKVSDMFNVEEMFDIEKTKDDCVRTSQYIPKFEEVAYSLFEDKVRKINEQFKVQEINIEDFYIELLLAYDTLKENLEPRGYMLVKKIA